MLYIPSEALPNFSVYRRKSVSPCYLKCSHLFSLIDETDECVVYELLVNFFY